VLSLVCCSLDPEREIRRRLCTDLFFSRGFLAIVAARNDKACWPAPVTRVMRLLRCAFMNWHKLWTPIDVVYERAGTDDSSTARHRDAAPRILLSHYEVERVYLTEADGRPAQTIEAPVLTNGASAKEAALAFVANEGARLLGPPSEVPGDLCTATAWKGGRLYVITVWRLGHTPLRTASAPSASN
jgi:hypothetical protein